GHLLHFFFYDMATPEYYTLSYTTLFRSKDLKISGLQWETITARDLYDLQKDQIIPFEIKDVAYTTQKGIRTAHINVSLFKSENGRILRLSSFNIEETVKQNFSTQKVGTTNNPLNTGNFYKIKVDKSGIFKITKEF